MRLPSMRRVDALHAPARRAAIVVAAIIAVACSVAILAPPLAQDAAYHAFADVRTLFGVPHAADVLSSVAFLVVALAGVARLADVDRPRFDTTTEASAWALVAGLAATSFGSAYYHLDPRDGTLFFDRLPMTLAFAAIVAQVASQRIGPRFGAWLMLLVAVLGVASVLYWRTTGNLTAYGALQVGAALALVACIAITPSQRDPFPWWWVVGWYALAKVAELFDREIFTLTAGLVAGHALKHVTAAAAGAAALWPLLRRQRVSRPT